MAKWLACLPRKQKDSGSILKVAQIFSMVSPGKKAGSNDLTFMLGLSLSHPKL